MDVSYTHGHSAAISVHNATDIQLRSVSISNSAIGVLAENISTIRLSAMRISKSITAVSIKGAERAKCSGVFMTDCGVVGIELENSIRTTLYYCLVNITGETGIRLRNTDRTHILYYCD